jgi:hypothetical protein
MSERHGSPYDSTAHKWLALIERRQRNFIELWETGRWQHYYTHPDFLDQMRKVLDLRNRWAVLAGVPVSGKTAIRQNIMQAGIKQTSGLDGEIGLPEQVPPQAAGKAGQQRTSKTLLAAVSAPL